METTDQIKLKFTIASTDYSVPLGMRVFLDNTIIYENSHVLLEQQIEHLMPDTDGEHELSFELFGKKPEHTKINEAGEILSDAMLSISGVEMDEIDIHQIFQKIAVYHHDVNGTQAPVEEKFYDKMGCNGAVKLKFTTPGYLWLLENM
jgi:hypothetical protein